MSKLVTWKPQEKQQILLIVPLALSSKQASHYFSHTTLCSRPEVVMRI